MAMKAYLEYWDIDLMEQATTCLRDRLLIRLLSRLGCRISELLAVKINDIDFNQGTVTIQHLKTRIVLFCANCKSRLGRGYIFCPKCGESINEDLRRFQDVRRIRTLPLDQCTLNMLKGYIGNISSNSAEVRIFRLNRHRAWQIIKDCARKAGIPDLINPETGRLRGVSPHRLRDAFSVHAIKTDDSGDGLRLLQEHLGHASFNTTAKYRKIAGDEHRQWYDRLWNQ